LVNFSESYARKQKGFLEHSVFASGYWSDRGRWNETAAIVGAGSINVTGLHTGQPHTFRVVGMNGVADIVRKTRSDPHTVEGEGTVS